MTETAKSARQTAILEMVVRAYIKHGVPVSSGEIAVALRHSVSSATIRLDMVTLTDAGYLLQPHTSAGRVPTANAYRIVTERMLAREQGVKQERVRRRHVAVADVAYRLAQESQAAAYVSNQEGTAIAGCAFVLTAPELAHGEQALTAFAHLVDALPAWAEQISAALEGRYGVFVAEENPIHPSVYFSIVATRLPGNGIAAVIGPLRMRYEAAIRSLASL